MLQVIADGLVLGTTIALGAIGLTLVYAILRFANFTHGELMTWGAYLALTALAFAAATGLPSDHRFPGLSFGWPFLAALAVGAAGAGLIGLALDWALFARLRRHGTAIVMVIASFGAALALRHLITFFYGPSPDYFSRDIQIALPVLPGVRMTADQMVVAALAALLVALLHLFLSRTTLGRAMRATAENPALARVIGIDVARVVAATWLIGGALAAVAGVFVGLTVQLRPQMGFDMLLPLFAAAILGGIGSVRGAVAGGLIVGLAQSLAVPLIGAEYRQAVAFLVLLAVLLARPEGLFGERP
jgi:branched-chain amino acid transport system permease protein